MISQITPDGARPARRARSTAASVCPALTSTPPLRARNVGTCPGLARSDAFVAGLIATWIVYDLSAAEIPVVTPSLASIGSLNAVPNMDVLRFATRGIASSSSRSSVMARQISPRPCVAMKLIASAVTCSAAMVRSPSFSRCSSSRTMIMRPWRNSSNASSTDTKATGQSYQQTHCTELEADFMTYSIDRLID